MIDDGEIDTIMTGCGFPWFTFHGGKATYRAFARACFERGAESAGWRDLAAGAPPPSDQRVVLAMNAHEEAFEEFFRAKWVRGEWRSEDGEIILHGVTHWCDLPRSAA